MGHFPLPPQGRRWSFGQVFEDHATRLDSGGFTQTRKGVRERYRLGSVRRQGPIVQCGAPKIAKLVYNSNNYGLW